MRRFRPFLAALIFGLATLGGAAVAQASEAGACSGDLAELSDLEVSLDGLIAAHAEGESLRRDLRIEAFDLAVAIETLKLDSAPAKVIARVQAQREAVLAELAASEKIAPVLAKQIAVLSADVDASSRAYLACVEATIG